MNKSANTCLRFSFKTGKEEEKTHITHVSWQSVSFNQGAFFCRKVDNKRHGAEAILDGAENRTEGKSSGEAPGERR